MDTYFCHISAESNDHAVCQGALARSCNPGRPERADDAVPSEAFQIGETKFPTEENRRLQRNNHRLHRIVERLIAACRSPVRAAGCRSSPPASWQQRLSSELSTHDGKCRRSPPMISGTRLPSPTHRPAADASHTSARAEGANDGAHRSVPSRGSPGPDEHQCERTVAGTVIAGPTWTAGVFGGKRCR